MTKSSVFSSLRDFARGPPPDVPQLTSSTSSGALNVSRLFGWQEYNIPAGEPANTVVNASIPVPAQGFASAAVHQEVYISLTSTSFRIATVHRVIEHIFAGFMWPDRLYLFLSSTAFLMDSGVRPDSLPETLLEVAARFPVSIIFTDNIGAHRKLLPLLGRLWLQDVVIITVDDDTLYTPKFLSSFMRSYVLSNRSSIIASRVRRISLCDQPPYATLPYVYWNRQHCDSVKNKLLVLPTGVGGVLYRPSFLHPAVFDSALRHVTRFNDDLLFRAASLLRRVPVFTACVANSLKLPSPPAEGDSLPRDLYSHNKNRNSLMWEETLQLIARRYPPTDTVFPVRAGSAGAVTELSVPSLPALVGEALHKERNMSAAACAPSPLRFTIERVFRAPNECGVYSCSMTDQVIRRVVNDDPLSAVVVFGQLLLLLLTCVAVRRGCAGVCDRWLGVFRNKVSEKNSWGQLKLKH